MAQHRYRDSSRHSDISPTAYMGRTGGVFGALGIGAAILCGSATAAADDTPTGDPSASHSSGSAAARSAAVSSAKPSVAKARSARPTRQPGNASVSVTENTSLAASPMRPLASATITAIRATPVVELSTQSAVPVAEATSSNTASASATETASSANGAMPTNGTSAISAAPAGQPTLAAIAQSILRYIQTTFFNRTPTIYYDPTKNVINPDGTITGRVVGSDADGDTLTYTVTVPANGGTVVMDQNGTFTFTPGADFVEDDFTDFFTTTVSDATPAGPRIHGLLGLLIPGWGSTARVATQIIGARTVPGTWGTPSRTVDFTDWSVLAKDWVIYHEPTKEGNRIPGAITFADGIMTITGDAAGNDGGMAWVPGQMYGGWEVRLRVPAGARNYDAVLLLWPDAENWPAGGEIDFMEMWDDPTRQTVNSVLHHGPENKQIIATMSLDATQWHDYAVKWTPTEITTYVDGVPLFHTTDTSTFPPGLMHLCIQLDIMGPDIAAGAQMQVAWAKQYSLNSVV